MEQQLRFLILIVFLLVGSQHANSQVGQQFPSINGETLSNKPIKLPGDAKGKYTLIGVAYSQKAQKDLDSWAEPVYYEFLNQSGLTAMVYDVNVYMVMMFTGSKKVVYATAKKKIREGTDKKLHKHTFLFKGKLADYQEKLNLKDKRVPAFFVLDENGKVIHFVEGAYTSRKFDKITSLVEN